MFFARLKAVTVIVVALIISFGCETDNDDNVDCMTSDCEAACTALGYREGSCVDNSCECTGENGGAYLWNHDAGPDDGADSGTS